MTRRELSALSEIISANVDAEGFRASELEGLKELMDRPGVGMIFLIICEDYPGPGGKWYSLHTKAELGLKQVPPLTFHKAGKLNVLVKEKRKFDLLMAAGWL